ncbi:KH domain-containing, RNA-binding, signal transduction-associated protein 2-like isoform X1 [Asterias amurensis]|uniref:KH domain-containing, RNA-binding, signal transduction-associated protein 2-like isoform X1 n=1 Tax=Asterias amurensis TaxID=7602 RepID=UPI003AB6FFD6
MENVEDRTARLQSLKQEKEGLDPALTHSKKVINDEIKRLEAGIIQQPKYIDIITDKPLKLEVRVLIPTEEHPKFNFVGKLLGPRGNSLKRMQEMTGTRMSILGKGSLRDKKKEDELREEGSEKHAHLNEDLHVLIEVYAPAADAYNRLAYGIAEVRKYLIPDPNDEIRQSQLRELAIISGSYNEPPAGTGRGVSNAGSRGAMSHPGPMGRGAPPNMHGRFPSPPQGPQGPPGRPFPGPPGGAPSPSIRGGGVAGSRGGYQGGFGRQQQSPGQFNSGRMPPPPQGVQGEYNEGYSARGEGFNTSGGPSGYQDETANTSDPSDSTLETRWILLYASTKQGLLSYITPKDLPTKERDVWEKFFRSRLP